MMDNLSDDFEQLINRHLHGALDGDEGRRLAQLLTDDPNKMQEYVRAATLHYQIRCALRSDQAISPEPGYRGRRLWSRVALIAGSIGTLAAAIAVWWTLGRPNERPYANSAATPVYKLGVSSVQLTSGSAKLLLPGVGYVVVEGPTDFELLDPMRARLNRGRITVRVTEEEGHGFVVESPRGKVIDLGTEFGLNVSDDGNVSLAVFDGEVDLQMDEPKGRTDESPRQRLVEGEAVSLEGDGQVNRIVSLVRTTESTFRERHEPDQDKQSSIITQISDNLRSSETKKFYEIVPAGLREDVLAYVDRPRHEWNGVSAEGMPPYLVGADYVKMFMQDKTRRNVKIKVHLSRPADLYVFYDERLPTPEWLQKDFLNTGDRIGVDVVAFRGAGLGIDVPGVGPGVKVDDSFTVWRRTIKAAEVIELGPNVAKNYPTRGAAMYGIAAVGLANEKSEQ